MMLKRLMVMTVMRMMLMIQNLKVLAELLCVCLLDLAEQWEYALAALLFLQGHASWQLSSEGANPCHCGVSM